MNGVGCVLASAREFFALLVSKPTAVDDVLPVAPSASEGWHSYIYEHPDQDTEIEIQRIGAANIDRVIPRRLNPEFNVAGLYWRPITKAETV